jgi:hypothetical protein
MFIFLGHQNKATLATAASLIMPVSRSIFPMPLAHVVTRGLRYTLPGSEMHLDYRHTRTTWRDASRPSMPQLRPSNFFRLSFFVDCYILP